MVFLIEKESDSNEYSISYGKIKNNDINQEELIEFLKNDYKKDSSLYIKFENQLNRNDFIDKYIKFIPPTKNKIINKLKKLGNFKLLEDEIFSGIDITQDFVNTKHLAKLGKGFKSGDGIFVLNDAEKNNYKWNNREIRLLQPYFTTNEINRYFSSNHNKHWIIYTTSKFNYEIDKYPNIKKHLDKYKKVITSDNKPYGLHRARDRNNFIGEKILSIRKCKGPSFSYVDFPCYVSRAFLIIKTNRINIKYLLALLNSKVIKFWFYYKGKLQGDLFQIDKTPLINVPIVKVTKDTQKEIIVHVDTIYNIKSRTDFTNENIDRQKIYEIERKINQLVYQLYELTDKEIEIIENFNK